MLQINELSMQCGGRLLYDEVNLNLLPGLRYGLIGANGTGKTTFLRLLAEEESPSLGSITCAKRSTFGWLKQDTFRYEQHRIVDVVVQGNSELWEAFHKKETLLNSSVFDEKTATELAHHEEIIAHHDGYSAETRAASLLVGLGIPQAVHTNPLHTLSGGYKLRVLLAQVLFQAPDIMLLDEPTNHLDIMTTEWLEGYLKKEYRGVLVFISHDFDFLNNLATHILDIDYGEIKEYVGNYEKSMEQKKEIMEQKLHQQAYLDKKIAMMQRFVDRFGAKASKAKQAKSREKMIEKIELPDIKHSSRISPNFQFQQKRPSGKKVLEATGIGKSYDTKRVLHQVKFKLQRGEKVALIGHNGIGKSTLLKIVLDRLKADHGTFEWGHNVQVSYFAQDHHELLNESCDLLTWLTEQVPEASHGEVRNALGKVLFTQDDVFKNVLNISGGEGARLLLAKNMLERSNVLVLDEPTNHLDLDAIEALSEALKNYPGTILLVSHNRHFVSKAATRIIALTEKGLEDYHGTYQEYLSDRGHDFLSRQWLAAHG